MLASVGPWAQHMRRNPHKSSAGLDFTAGGVLKLDGTSYHMTAIAYNGGPNADGVDSRIVVPVVMLLPRATGAALAIVLQWFKGYVSSECSLPWVGPMFTQMDGGAVESYAFNTVYHAKTDGARPQRAVPSSPIRLPSLPPSLSLLAGGAPPRCECRRYGAGISPCRTRLTRPSRCAQRSARTSYIKAWRLECRSNKGK
jgi:hypothetical protein